MMKTENQDTNYSKDLPPIEGFRGDHAFLSNFHPAIIRMSTHLYRSVEHAYQAAKTLDSDERYMIRMAPTPAEAKHLGSKVTIQPLWETIKVSTMESLLMRKFSRGNLYLLRGLLATGDRKLIEENQWGDMFWGTCGGVGSNQLGRLLMRVREMRQAQEERRKVRS